MSSGSVPPLHGVDHLHVHVSDRAAAERGYARVRGLTRVPELEDHGLSWSLHFADPDGNPCELASYAYAELAARLRAGA